MREGIFGGGLKTQGPRAWRMLNEELIWVSQAMPLRGAAAGEPCADSVGPPTWRRAVFVGGVPAASIALFRRNVAQPPLTNERDEGAANATTQRT